MKNMKTALFSAALAGCMLLAGTAQASDYGTVNATLTNPPGVDPGLSDGVNGGVFNFQKNSGSFPLTLLNGASGKFIAFCLDIGQSINYNTAYTFTVRDVAEAPVPAGAMGSVKATDIAKLVGGVLSGSFSNVASILDTDLKASAFQLAIWEIVNEKNGGYDVKVKNDASGFMGGSTLAVQNLANGYLAMMLNASAASGLFALTSGSTQDFLVQAVPIPAAAWLLGSGLLGLFGLARRKTVVATA